MKKTIILLLMLGIASTVKAEEIKIHLNGEIVPPLPEKHQTAIKNENDIMFLPLRNIFEAMGAVVIWSDDSKTVYGGKGTMNYEIQYDNSLLIVNGTKIKLNYSPVFLNDRILTTDTVINSCFNANIEYDNDLNTVNIIYDTNEQDSVVIDFGFTEDYKDE